MGVEIGTCYTTIGDAETGVKISFRISPDSLRDGHKRVPALVSDWCNIRLIFSHIQGRAGLRAK